MVPWLHRTSVTLLVAAWLAAAAPAAAQLSLPSNTGVKRPTPTQTTLTGFPGTFQARGWNHMIYDPNGKRMILYDGYLDATRPYSIYANALWGYDVIANRLSLETVSNWTRTGAGTVPLPANTTNPTPWDRHSYSCIAIAPEQNRLYLWGGANNSISTGWVGDTWLYDFATKRWREITVSTHPYNVFEQTMTYDPSTHRLVLFGGGPSAYDAGQDAWLFDVNSELWERAATASAPAQRMSHSMVYDSMRRLSYVFGGGTYPSPGNEMWAFDASSRVWQRLLPANTPPVARRFAALAYDSRHDIVMMWGGIRDENTLYNDTWIYRPGTRQWQQLVPPASPPSTGMNSEDLAYDPENDVFILHQNGEFWVFRYASSSDPSPPGTVSDLRIR